MTTLVPREPYSQEELDRLYPRDLKLQLVQVVSAGKSTPPDCPCETLANAWFSFSVMVRRIYILQFCFNIPDLTSALQENERPSLRVSRMYAVQPFPPAYLLQANIV